MFNHEGKTSGKILENEMLGGINERLYRKEIGDSYLPYKKAMEVVRKMQQGDPSDPEKRFASDLHATVAEILELENYEKLRFFSAVGSHLDFHHGIDAFFELDKDNGEIKIITLDLTGNQEKDTYKANVLIKIPSAGLDPKEDKEEYKAKILAAGEVIADLFREEDATIKIEV